MSWKILSQNFHSCNYDESKILEFSALFKIKSWNFLQKKFSNSMTNWDSWNFLVPLFSFLQCSVWKFSVLEFCFTENTWIPIVEGAELVSSDDDSLAAMVAAETAGGKLLHNYLLTTNKPPLQDPKGAMFY